ncbi:arsenosugar biosynthesis radical SAM (seleno)protein ArsS [uncultured Thiodictyon sp.]|jgi:radical SAM/Cys-rich protein|uniref:arsenosugar biosynthesis radical SAM (seleno)protein ArsS n=1 Tax=uncultured Thiodictyon sp. TaxID=1846217 RepID=UPI0025FD8112|nr:arsenosugar biosynthesis radical SAM (seleno)protein ArsS [uncultured Thiodictyon sp.]
MHATLPRLRDSDFPALRRGDLKTLQANLGYRCNLSCLHCHVAAGPNRTERMDRDTIDTILAVLARGGIETLDLTGGAPELHPDFRDLVTRARALGVRVIDRCNLTILAEPGQEDLAEFLAAAGVEIIASLPGYLREAVEAQRGKGVFDASIAGLRRLNALGYGRGDAALVLSLVYNPQGPALPPEQTGLETAYRARLDEAYGIRFDRLYTLANMPIQRFGSTLISKGRFDAYLQLLKAAHRADNLGSVMCRDLISIDWRGFVYDCDFNQMLDLPLHAGTRSRLHLRDLEVGRLPGLPIQVADHCYGCTAGQGSSCSGALAG